MPRRLVLAVVLGMTTAAGCASVSEETVSLVASKPLIGGWPFRRTPSEPRVRSTDTPPPATQKTPARESASGNSAATRDARFLESLPVDLRERIEAELAQTGPEERARLLSYLATVELARIPALLDARQSARTKPAPSSQPAVITADASGQPEMTLEATTPGDGPVQLAAAEFESTESADPISDLTEPPAATPLPRPRRNPLVEIDPVGVEFEEATAPERPVGENPLAPPRVTAELPLEPKAPGQSAETPSAASINPLTRLREWTTIRKPEPSNELASAGPPPAASPADASALSLQNLGRKLRVVGPRTEEAQHSSPASGQDSPYLNEGIQKLISLMEAETARLKPGTSFAEREEYVRRHAELRMLYLMSGQRALSQQAIPGVDTDTQEFWTSMMWSMSNYFDDGSMGDPGERAAAALDRLRVAEQHLQTTANLELRQLTFCDKIDGFGAYHPFEQNVFRAGQPVLLYAEVRNFKTEATPAGRYRTSLRSTIEIVKTGDAGEVIERRPFEATEDLSRSHRTDYFHSYKLDLPLHLTPGSYSLRLTLEDELSGKIGTSTIDFLVR